jgi:hypothetical protein
VEIEYKYESYVNTSSILFKGDINQGFRYLLKIPLHNANGKKVLVIMKNPSKANNDISDLTINRVLKFCNGQGYSEVNIMNLYSYYSTDSSKIAYLIDHGQEKIAIGKENDTILNNLLQDVDDVIVAWGSNTFGLTTQYKRRIKQVIEIIKKKPLFYVEANNGRGWYPKHPQVWSVNSGIQKYGWVPPIGF